MAYPYNPVNYNPTYYQTPYYTPTATQMPQISNNTPTATNAPTTANNGLIWVQGETGAKSYIVAPGASVLLMDSEAQRFFIKSADTSGMPLPLRTFEYKEIGAAVKVEAEEVKTDVDFGKYVTREEFDRRIAELTPKKSGRKSEVKDDE
jgi:hypothetical protein